MNDTALMSEAMADLLAAMFDNRFVGRMCTRYTSGGIITAMIWFRPAENGAGPAYILRVFDTNLANSICHVSLERGVFQAHARLMSLGLGFEDFNSDREYPEVWVPLRPGDLRVALGQLERQYLSICNEFGPNLAASAYPPIYGPTDPRVIESEDLP